MIDAKQIAGWEDRQYGCCAEHDCIDAGEEITRLRAEIAAKEAECVALLKEKNGAYRERNKVVAALAKLWPAGVLPDKEDSEWVVVYIDLPPGQVSWHFHKSELPLLQWLHPYRDAWDGHSTEEKYARLDKLSPSPWHYADD